MSGKFRFISQRKGRDYDRYDSYTDALLAAKKAMAWRSDSYADDTWEFFVVQEVSKIERPPVDDAIVTTL